MYCVKKNWRCEKIGILHCVFSLLKSLFCRDESNEGFPAQMMALMIQFPYLICFLLWNMEKEHS